MYRSVQQNYISNIMLRYTNIFRWKSENSSISQSYFFTLQILRNKTAALLNITLLDAVKIELVIYDVLISKR